MNLFSNLEPPEKKAPDKGAPLADRMRPQRLEDYAGQKHLLAPGKPFLSDED